MADDVGRGRRLRRRVVRPGPEREAVLGAEPGLAEGIDEYASGETGAGVSADEARLLADRPPHWQP